MQELYLKQQPKETRSIFFSKDANYPAFLKNRLKETLGEQCQIATTPRWANPDNLKLHPLFATGIDGDIQTPIAVRTLSTITPEGVTINNKGAALAAGAEISPKISRLLISQPPELPGGLSYRTACIEYQRSIDAHTAFHSMTHKHAKAVIPTAVIPIGEVNNVPVTDFLTNGYTDQIIRNLRLPETDDSRAYIYDQLNTILAKLGWPAQLINVLEGIDIRLTDGLGTIIGPETIDVWEGDFMIEYSQVANSSAFPSPLLEWTRISNDALTNAQIINGTLGHLFTSFGFPGLEIDPNSDPKDVIKAYWERTDENKQLFDAFIYQLVEFTLALHASGLSLSDRKRGNGGSLTGRNVTMSADVMDLVTVVGEDPINQTTLKRRQAHDWFDMTLSIAILSRFLHPDLKYTALDSIFTSIHTTLEAHPNIANGLNYDTSLALSTERTLERMARYSLF